MQELRIVFDTKEAEEQVDEMVRLLELNMNNFLAGTGAFDDAVKNLLRLAFDVVLRDAGSALGADGILEKRFIIRGGARFDDTVSTLRAGKLPSFIHDSFSKTKP